MCGCLRLQPLPERGQVRTDLGVFGTHEIVGEVGWDAVRQHANQPAGIELRLHQDRPCQRNAQTIGRGTQHQ